MVKKRAKRTSARSSQRRSKRDLHPKGARRVSGGAPPAPKGPAAWFLDLTPDQRREQLAYLKLTTKQLRKTFTGFDSEKGYDLRHPERWPAQRRAQVQAYGAYLHQLTSGDRPYLIVPARSKGQKRALQRRTGQGLRRQKAFILHTEAPSNTRVIFKRDRKTRRVEIEVRRAVRGGEIVVRDFLFRELVGYQPFTFEEMQDALDEMLALEHSDGALVMPPEFPEDSGNEAYYSMLSELHGPISAPIPYSMLRAHLVQWQEEYGNTLHEGFAETLIGYRLQGTEGMADAEYNERDRRSRFRARRPRFSTQLNRSRKAIPGHRLGRVK